MSKRRRRLAGKLAQFKRDYGKRKDERRKKLADPSDARFDHKFDKKLRRMAAEEFDALVHGDGLDEAEGSSG